MHSGFPLCEAKGFSYPLVHPCGTALCHHMLLVLKAFIGHTSLQSSSRLILHLLSFQAVFWTCPLKCLLTTLTSMGIPPFGWKNVKCTPSFPPSTAVAMTTFCFHCPMIKIVFLYLLFRDGKQTLFTFSPRSWHSASLVVNSGPLELCFAPVVSSPYCLCVSLSPSQWLVPLLQSSVLIDVAWKVPWVSETMSLSSGV